MYHAAPAAQFDVAVVGAGPAGCGAALAAAEAGAHVLLADMAAGPGGALAAMSVPFEAPALPPGVEPCYGTALRGASHIEGTFALELLGPGGLRMARVGALVLATGGREVTRGNLAIAGTRPAGVFTARAALALLAVAGQPPGRRVVVAGGGRWAAATAQLLAQAGATIIAQVAGVARIDGWPRISGVALRDGSTLACDTLVLATPQQPWLAPPLAGLAALPGVFIAGAAAAGESSLAEAALHGAQCGRAAANWILIDKETGRLGESRSS